ncbi:MAG: hypothetical protein WB663_05140 [Beijerinckiaceae bacterium]
MIRKRASEVICLRDAGQRNVDDSIRPDADPMRAIGGATQAAADLDNARAGISAAKAPEAPRLIKRINAAQGRDPTRCQQSELFGVGIRELNPEPESFVCKCQQFIRRCQCRRRIARIVSFRVSQLYNSDCFAKAHQLVVNKP